MGGGKLHSPQQEQDRLKSGEKLLTGQQPRPDEVLDEVLLGPQQIMNTGVSP
jgi:hypothetical protein